MLYELLKERTSASHQALEKDLVRKIREINSKEAYVHLLKMMYGYYYSLEQGVSGYLANDPQVNFAERRKASTILKDLHNLQHRGEVEVCEDMPDIHSNESALGAMYVMEGSTLGGQHIARMIQSQLQVRDSAGLQFFHGYGPETQNMWESFKLNLTRPFTDSQADEIVETANDTFRTFKNWVDSYAANKL